MFSKYKQTIDNYINQGYARKLTEEERMKVTNRTWYLPHHSLFNPKKLDKIRVAFDAAAKNKGEILNWSLSTGPDLRNSLIGVLLRFWNNNIAKDADTEAMFHQVRVKPSDCDSLRFLWTDIAEKNSKVETYQMLVHIISATDSPCCANFAVKTVATNNSENYSAIA